MMDCFGESDSATYLKEFHKKVVQQRIPLSGMLDLTHRCNLQCVHCYLGHQHKNQQELNTQQWFTLIDEFVAMGCLFLVLTGGEPFLRHDFADIYRYAKNKGLLVTVFTNGTLLTDQLYALFVELPPSVVDITIYGATAETYETITRIPGSFEKCSKGIRQLLEAGVRVSLKTILMTCNRHEFYDMENLAQAYGVDFRFDAGIIPCITGDQSPVSLRIPVKEGGDKEFSNQQRAQGWKDYFEQKRTTVFDDALFQCGSGQFGFYINPYGFLQPCMMVTDLQYDLSHGCFQEGWDEVLPRIRNRKAPEKFVCNSCEQRILCNFCPSTSALETGSEKIPSEYLCAIGLERFKRIQQMA